MPPNRVARMDTQIRRTEYSVLVADHVHTGFPVCIVRGCRCCCCIRRHRLPEHRNRQGKQNKHEKNQRPEMRPPVLRFTFVAPNCKNSQWIHDSVSEYNIVTLQRQAAQRLRLRPIVLCLIQSPIENIPTIVDRDGMRFLHHLLKRESVYRMASRKLFGDSFASCGSTCTSMRISHGYPRSS